VSFTAPVTSIVDRTSPPSNWQGFGGATRTEETLSETQTQNSQGESRIAQHMSHEQDQVSNLLGMVAGMAKDEKTRQALLRRQARVESHAESVGSNQLMADAASFGEPMSAAASPVPVTRASSKISEEERSERMALAWRDTGVAQGALLPATAPHRISGTWQAQSMPLETVEEPKPKGRWDSSILDAIGKTAAAMGVSSAETPTTAAPAKRDSLMAAFMHHSKNAQLHRVDSKQAESGLEKDANLFSDQDAQDLAQEQASQERRKAAHEAEVHAMYEDGAEGVLSTRAAPPNSALSRFMGIAPSKQTSATVEHPMELKTGSALDAFTFDDPTPSPQGKKMALASTQSIMSRNLASWLGYESTAPSQPKANAAVTRRKTNENWYLVDLGLENSQ